MDARRCGVDRAAPQLRLLAEGETAENTLWGTVAETIYYGLGLRLAIRLQDGSRVWSDMLLPDSLARSAVPQVGQPVCLSVQPHNVFVFEADPDAEAAAGLSFGSAA